MGFGLGMQSQGPTKTTAQLAEAHATSSAAMPPSAKWQWFQGFKQPHRVC